MFKLVSRAALTRLGARFLCSGTQQKLAGLVKENKIVVFMKGTPEQPMCGFSRAVVQILEMHEVGSKNLTTHNVLEGESIRQGVKDFTSWPTIPQVFLEGEFVGGCDIMLEMHKSGELIDQLKNVGIKSALDDTSDT